MRWRGGQIASAVSKAVYTIAPPAATPVLNLAAGTYSKPQKIWFTDATAGATMYYTTNGTTPNPATSTKYVGSFLVSSTETVQAIAIAAPGYSESAVAKATYTITP